MSEKKPIATQPCNITRLEEGLKALEDYAARVKPRVARRLQDARDLFSRIEVERAGEKKELDALAATYFPREEAIPQRLDKCIVTLREILRNSALPKGVFDVSDCVHGQGPCPPERQADEDEPRPVGRPRKKRRKRR